MFDEPTYYATYPLTSMAHVRQLFPSGRADELNWLLCSTSGVHGSYVTLEDCERLLRHPDPEETLGGDTEVTITILVIQPRIVRTYWGDLPITLADIPLLRELVTSTLVAVMASQRGNLHRVREQGD